MLLLNSGIQKPVKFMQMYDWLSKWIGFRCLKLQPHFYTIRCLWCVFFLVLFFVFRGGGGGGGLYTVKAILMRLCSIYWNTWFIHLFICIGFDPGRVPFLMMWNPIHLVGATRASPIKYVNMGHWFLNNMDPWVNDMMLLALVFIAFCHVDIPLQLSFNTFLACVNLI